MEILGRGRELPLGDEIDRMNCREQVRNAKEKGGTRSGSPC